MFESSTSSLITKIVDTILRPAQREIPTEWNDNGSITQVAMVMELRANASNFYEYPDSDEYEQLDAFANVYFIFCGGTSVFFFTDWGKDRNASIPIWGKDRVFRMEEIPLEDYENTSNHDSCWKSDGVEGPLSNLYFGMCEEINIQRQKLGGDRIAPRDIDTSVDFGFGAPWKMMNVTHKTSTENNYSRVLERIEYLDN